MTHCSITDIDEGNGDGGDGERREESGEGGKGDPVPDWESE